jgi:hypothetical protein
VKDIESHEEPRTGRWTKRQSEPSVRTLKVTTDEITKKLEEYAEKIQWMEDTGRAMDQEHTHFIEEARTKQMEQNENVRKFVREGNDEGLGQLAQVQTRLDHAIHQRLDQHYSNERRLRIQAINELKELRELREFRARTLQSRSSPSTSSMSPIKEEIQRVEQDVKRPRKGEITEKAAPIQAPSSGSKDTPKIPTYKAPPIGKGKAPPPVLQPQSEEVKRVKPPPPTPNTKGSQLPQMPSPEALPRDERAQEVRRREMIEAKATSEQERIEVIPPPPKHPPPKLIAEQQLEAQRKFLQDEEQRLKSVPRAKAPPPDLDEEEDEYDK